MWLSMLSVAVSSAA
jgi:hypothetical protein